MSEAFDPFWQATAEHVRHLGLSAREVLAPDGFQALLPGTNSASNAPPFDRLNALVLHKGGLEQVPGEHLLAAIDSFQLTFANEVFLVLSKTGEPVGSDNPHWMDRDHLLRSALIASDRKSTHMSRSERMPATYVGEGRVLLETAFGHLMVVDGADISIVPHLVRDGWFDRNLTDSIRGLIEPGMTVIDIGANFGTYTVIAASKVGEQGRVIAVEPAPAISDMLAATLSMNGFEKRAKLVRCALAAEDGIQTLYEFTARQGGSTLVQTVAESAKAVLGEEISTRQVECRTLDAVLAEEALERLDVVKIDVEGFELEVLKGARQSLARFRPRLILEWHPEFLKSRDGVAEAQYDLLTAELNYRLNRIEAGGKYRAVEFEELMSLEHSDVLAEPSEG